MTSLTYNEDLMRQAKRTIREADRSGKLSAFQRSALMDAGFPFGRGTPCTDHLGQMFYSVKAMCEHWGVDNGTFNSRIRRGCTLEEALTTPLHSYNFTDHLGQEFSSKEAMCEAWGITDSIYNARIKLGWSVEEALTGNRENKRGPKPCKDHTGREFSSIKAMCEAWGMAVATYNNRRKKGMSLEEALTTPLCSYNFTDHLGQEYPSISAMLEAWGVSYGTFKRRMEVLGWTLEEALTGTGSRGNTKTCVDHTGQAFPSIEAMCEHWGVNSTTFKARLKQGWPLEKALAAPKELPSTEAINIDHLGQQYPTQKAMCEAWGVSSGTFRHRMKVLGWTLEEALTGNGPDSVCDHTDECFPSIKAMCEHWGVDYSNYKARIRQGWSVEDALTSGKRAKGTPRPCTDHLGQEFPSELAMCKHWGVSANTFQNRIQRSGWTVEQALTGFGPDSKRDHTGRLFPSQKAMAEAWGVSNRLYWSRRNSGWSLEEALTGIRKKGGNAK